MMASFPQIGGFAESLKIALELNQIEPFRVFSAQKAVPSLHYRDANRHPDCNACFPIS